LWGLWQSGVSLGVFKTGEKNLLPWLFNKEASPKAGGAKGPAAAAEKMGAWGGVSWCVE
jgi:hypothetical protein